MTPLITADERTRLLANGQPALPGRTPTRCPWCACSRQMRMPPLLASLDPADGDTAHGLIDPGLVCLRWAL